MFTLNVPPVKTIRLLLLLANSVPTLLITPPFNVSTLLDDTPVPSTRLPFSMFHTMPPSLTVTALLDAPAPMVRPVLQTLALVTVIVLLLPPVLPTVISPLFEKVTALLLPMMFKLLFVAPAPKPTVIAPLP